MTTDLWLLGRNVQSKEVYALWRHHVTVRCQWRKKGFLYEHYCTIIPGAVSQCVESFHCYTFCVYKPANKIKNSLFCELPSGIHLTSLFKVRHTDTSCWRGSGTNPLHYKTDVLQASVVNAIANQTYTNSGRWWKINFTASQRCPVGYDATDYSISLIERQFVVTHNSSNWDSHVTRQLGYKHTFCQNVVSTKNYLYLSSSVTS
jgi:hypothetical protein